MTISSSHNLFMPEITKMEINSSCIAIKGDFNVEAYSDSLYEENEIIPPQDIIEKAVTKRKAEYLAGRIVAQSGIKKLTGKNIQVSRGKNREPLWPRGIVGSITHSKETAICIVSNDDQLLIGADIENIISTEMALSIQSEILNQSEINALQHNEDSFYNLLLTVSFSAKETLYKALFPKVRRYFGFKDTEITGIDIIKKKLTLSLSQSLSKGFPKGRDFLIDYSLDKTSVFTYLINQAV